MNRWHTTCCVRAFLSSTRIASSSSYTHTRIQTLDVRCDIIREGLIFSCGELTLSTAVLSKLRFEKRNGYLAFNHLLSGTSLNCLAALPRFHRHRASTPAITTSHFEPDRQHCFLVCKFDYLLHDGRSTGRPWGVNFCRLGGSVHGIRSHSGSLKLGTENYFIQRISTLY